MGQDKATHDQKADNTCVHGPFLVAAWVSIVEFGHEAMALFLPTASQGQVGDGKV